MGWASMDGGKSILCGQSILPKHMWARWPLTSSDTCNPSVSGICHRQVSAVFVPRNCHGQMCSLESVTDVTCWGEAVELCASVCPCVSPRPSKVSPVRQSPPSSCVVAKLLADSTGQVWQLYAETTEAPPAPEGLAATSSTKQLLRGCGYQGHI